MNILFLHTSGILGGSERAFLDLLERLSPSDQSSAIVVLPAQGALKEEIHLRCPAVRIEVIPFPGLFEKVTQKKPLGSLGFILSSLPGFTGYYRSLLRLITEQKIDLLYSNGIKCHLLSLPLKKLKKIKLAWHLQDFFPSLRYVRSYLSLFREGPDLIIANSNAVLEQTRSQMPTHWKSDYVTVHNAVDTEHYRSQTGPKTNGKTCVTMVGMLTPWKGQLIFLEAAALLLKQQQNIEFLIVGDELYKTHGESGYKRELESFIDSRGLRSHVRLTGFHKDLRSIFEASDILVHASLKPEPFGRVIIEAMSFEKPVVATRGGGVVEIIEDNHSGLLVEMGNAQEMAQALSKLIDNPSLRATLAKNARQRVVSGFSAEKFASRIQEKLRAL